MEDKVKYQLRNLVIPHQIYQDNRLNWTSARVYSFIHSYTNPFYFGNEHLAEMFGVHEQTISTAMGQLEKLGYIKTKYTVKADGGKTRLSVDTQSDRVKSLIPTEKAEAPTERYHSDKDIKDNNIKGKILENSDNLSELKERLAAKHEKQERKGSRPSYNTQAPSPRQPYMKKERRIADGRHIL